jgi:CBS domain-containing protein
MLVREAMTSPVVTVPGSASVKQAIRVLSERDLTAAPVVDENGDLAGIVSEMDLLRGEFEADPRAFARPVPAPDEAPPRRVTEVMTTEVRTARETTDVAELAEMMMNTGIKSVPVLEQGRLVGIVSRRDLLRMLAHSDARIRDDILTAVEELFPGDCVWEVSVNDGAVALHGHADVLTKKVVDILARTVPGVNRVIVIDAPANVPPGGPSRRIPAPEAPVRRQRGPAQRPISDDAGARSSA